MPFMTEAEGFGAFEAALAQYILAGNVTRPAVIAAIMTVLASGKKTRDAIQQVVDEREPYWEAPSGGL